MFLKKTCAQAASQSNLPSPKSPVTDNGSNSPGSHSLCQDTMEYVQHDNGHNATRESTQSLSQITDVYFDDTSQVIYIINYMCDQISLFINTIVHYCTK